MTEKSLATTAQARAWLIAHPKTLARLSPAALATVVPVEGRNLRGRMHPEAIALHNKGNRKSEYVLGATAATAQAQAKTASQARKAAARKAFRKGAVIGARGPLPKAFRG